VHERSFPISSLKFSFFPDPQQHKARLADLLRRHPAPVFFGDKAILADRYAALDRALKARWPEHIIAYSFKTNYFAAERFKELGAWAEVVSGREYELARRLGYSGDRIIFNGPWKSDDQLRRALHDGARIHANDVQELGRLAALAPAEGCEIALRVNTERTGLRPSRFGCSLDDGTAAEAIGRIADSAKLQLVGLHMHLLGDTDDPACYRRACEAIGQFMKQHVPDYADKLQYLDLGGGFPAHGPKPHRRASWNPRPIEEYVQTITSALAEFFPGEKKPTLILEPGRYLVGDGIIFISQVVRLQSIAGAQVITCNGSITMVPLTHYCPQVIHPFTGELERRDGAEMPSKVFGSSCREDDVIFEGPLPPVKVGDYLVHSAVGAYNSSLSPNFIFDAPPVVWL
jgi:diaminopimelate decarboxylase